MAVVSFRSRAVEMVGGIPVDAALAILLRSLVDGTAFEDLCGFCRDGATPAQLELLLRYMSARPLHEGVTHGRIAMDGDEILTTHIGYDDRVTWKNGLLVVRRTTLPLTVVNALEGEPLARIVAHPLLPDLVVKRASLASTTMTLATAAPPGAAKALPKAA